jgi:hypothetical protein
VNSVFGKINYGVLKHNSLYLGLVLPSGGWQSLIGLWKIKRGGAQLIKEFCQIARWGYRVFAMSDYPQLIQIVAGYKTQLKSNLIVTANLVLSAEFETVIYNLTKKTPSNNNVSEVTNSLFCKKKKWYLMTMVIWEHLTAILTFSKLLHFGSTTKKVCNKLACLYLAVQFSIVLHLRVRPEAIFTTLHFLRNLQIGPIS